MAKQKSSTKIAFEAFPFYEFPQRIWKFIRYPSIVGNKIKDSSLIYAWRDFLDSLLLFSGFLMFIKHLIPGLFKIELFPLINPVYLALLLAIHTIIFGFILSFITSLVLIAKEPRFHHLIIHQTLHSYAVANFIIIVIFAIGVNRALVTGDILRATNSIDLWVGGLFGASALYLIWRLLAKPLWHYIARYYNKTFSFVLLIIVIVVTLWINKHASFGFGNLIINKSEFCKQLYEIKRKSDEIPPSVDAECFIGKCMESNPKK